jgi:hypothetical protein
MRPWGGQGQHRRALQRRKDGASVYDRELRVQASWQSDFVGVVAVPAAINELYSDVLYES